MESGPPACSPLAAPEVQHLSEWDAYDYEQEFSRNFFRASKLAMRPRRKYSFPAAESAIDYRPSSMFNVRCSRFQHFSFSLP